MPIGILLGLRRESDRRLLLGGPEPNTGLIAEHLRPRFPEVAA
jgi:hypothetical protein